MKSRPRRKMIVFFLFFLVVSGLLVVVGVYNTIKELPVGISHEGKEYYASDLRFLRDLTWIDENGTRHLDHEIFDTILSMVKGAEHFVLLDLFLFNDFVGSQNGENRKLSRELTEVLISQKQKHPELMVIFITDPVNTVYGGMKNDNLDLLEKHGIKVVFTHLERLRDSNILYSPFWRFFSAPFGNGKGSLLSNPFGQGRVSVRSYLRLLNFKANHRKIIIADDGDRYKAVVTSANPHDGSSSHGNVAVQFSGMAVYDLLETEKAVLLFSSNIKAEFPEMHSTGREDSPTVQIVTEGAIKKTLLKEFEQAGPGDRMSLVMFYLSDRDVIQALIAAYDRGTEIQVLLDPNKDAFGRVKNGIPNRQVAAELVEAGISVRWGNTHGEQLHSKMMLVNHQDGTSFFILGSANFTRRNLGDFNLETNTAIRGRSSDQVFGNAGDYFSLLWNNADQKKFSVSYHQYEDHSRIRIVLYRWMEAIGMCTF